MCKLKYQISAKNYLSLKGVGSEHDTNFSRSEYDPREDLIFDLQIKQVLCNVLDQIIDILQE